MAITSGRITQRTITAKEPARTIVKRERIDGRKIVTMAINEGLTIGVEIHIVRIDNGADGSPRFAIQAPLSVVVGRVEAMSLVG